MKIQVVSFLALILAVCLARGNEIADNSVSEEVLETENNEIVDNESFDFEEEGEEDFELEDRDLEEDFELEMDNEEFDENHRELPYSYRRRGKGKGKGKGGRLPCCPCNQRYGKGKGGWGGYGKRGPRCRQCKCVKKCKSAIGDLVFDDLNNNGRDDGEPGIGGVTIALYREDRMNRDCISRYNNGVSTRNGQYITVNGREVDVRYVDRSYWGYGTIDERYYRTNGMYYPYNPNYYNRNYADNRYYWNNGYYSNNRYYSENSSDYRWDRDDGCGEVVETTVTDSVGFYLFEDLCRGDYCVVVTDYNNMLRGYSATGPARSVSCTSVGNDEEDLTQDFGYHRLPCCPRPPQGKRGKRGKRGPYSAPTSPYSPYSPYSGGKKGPYSPYSPYAPYSWKPHNCRPCHGPTPGKGKGWGPAPYSPYGPAPYYPGKGKGGKRGPLYGEYDYNGWNGYGW